MATKRNSTTVKKSKPYFKRCLVPQAATNASWSVPALCAAYNWPAGLAGGGVIGIVELDGGWVKEDLKLFFDSIGQPMPDVKDVSVNGVTNNPNQHLDDPAHDPDLEVALDIEVAAAAYYIATGKPATIRMYFADDIAPGVTKAVADGCDVFSISWGNNEAVWRRLGKENGRDLLKEMEDAATAATNAGMVVFAASGDNDAADGGVGVANVDVPASCPHVVACGGTKKTASSETVWNDTPGNAHGDGTGGGYSRYFPMQSFQSGAPHGPGRLVPDVAGNADQPTGYRIVVHGSEAIVGGTSAVAPLYAGLFAAFGKKLGFVSPKLWDNHLSFNDITVGDNGHYRARIGPDACTGLGSPIGTKLAELFGATAMTPAAVAGARPSTIKSHTYVHTGARFDK
jgi:subtilase family serine protease